MLSKKIALCSGFHILAREKNTRKTSNIWLRFRCLLICRWNSFGNALTLPKTEVLETICPFWSSECFCIWHPASRAGCSTFKNMTWEVPTTDPLLDHTQVQSLENMLHQAKGQCVSNHANTKSESEKRGSNSADKLTIQRITTKVMGADVGPMIVEMMSREKRIIIRTRTKTKMILLQMMIVDQMTMMTMTTTTPTTTTKLLCFFYLLWTKTMGLWFLQWYKDEGECHNVFLRVDSDMLIFLMIPEDSGTVIRYNHNEFWDDYC